MTSKPEFLLLSAQSESPYSTSYIDPSTGHALWSHKGNELRGSAVKFAEPVGRKGDVMLVGSASQNLLAIVSAAKFQPISCFVNSPVDSCAVDSTGTFVYLALQHKIFTFNIKTGEMIKVSSNSMAQFNRIVLSPDGKLMAVPSIEDGAVFIFKTIDLIVRGVLSEDTTPYKTLRYHRLPVTDLCFGPLDSSRLLTVSSDHSMVLWSIREEIPVIKMNVDEKLTSGFLNATELRIFLGSESGKLISISTEAARFNIAENDFLRAQGTDEEDNSLQIVDKHPSPILRIALNTDECKGASGDADGVVYIWDSYNLQTMFKIQKAGPITTLRFVPGFRSVTETDYVVDTTSVKPLHRELSRAESARITLHFGDDERWNKQVQALDDWMNSKEKAETSSSPEKKVLRPPTKRKSTESFVPLRTLSKSARRRLTKKRRQNPEEPDIIEVEEEATASEKAHSLAEFTALQAEMEKILKENEKLKSENKKLFEFAKKQLDGE
ncbi:unnamed protein product [Bursaphelenchus xylophilus]|uniref:(pine wood nematode) hypothetical protein n=1 Tax=Bursaphelenchus xylophilus TaxID=6326 RepID=A0A1I7RTJ6_BURXY|nr:unnamed protein product [Bursaphelenchus xylophilus]CAG9122393.1 unnamed protein product [Bursaphelenchus xylophilus]